jgi:hypothetical protein
MNILNARIRGLGHLSLVKGDYYSAEVQNNNNVLSKHVVKADLKYCSCLEWQHSGKPYQHALLDIIAQQLRNVGMKNFVDDYFSVDKFKKAYVMNMEELGDHSFRPKVEFVVHVGAPLAKSGVRRQRKNMIKGCLDGRSGKKASGIETGEIKEIGSWKVQLSKLS